MAFTPQKRFEHLSASESLVKLARSGIQREVAGVHFYPQVVVVEKNAHAREAIVAERHGTLWQPPDFWNRARKAALQPAQQQEPMSG